MNTCNSSCCNLLRFDGFATGERDVDSGDGDCDGEDLCTRLGLPVRGGEGKAIVSAGVKGENLPGINSFSNFIVVRKKFKSTHCSGACSKDGSLPC